MLPLSALKPTTRTFSRAFALLVLSSISAYKVLLSPLFSGCCRFEPSCSDYMAQAVRAEGPVRGVMLGLRRLARCHPFGGHGYDPVVCRPFRTAQGRSTSASRD